MTDVTGAAPAAGLNASGPARGHAGEMTLRRFLADELEGNEKDAVKLHTTACVECARRLETLRAEQQSFEQQISLDRFSAGVERAARAKDAPKHWWLRPSSTFSFVGMFGLGAVAATIALFVTARPLFDEIRTRSAANLAREMNHVKGDARPAVAIRIAPPDDGPQRNASVAAPERLAMGERLRIGVNPGGRHYLFAISIDDKGVVTGLYPEVGVSVALPPASTLQYLPDSVELTGAGLERMIVVLTDEPMELDIMARSAKESFEKAKGDLLHFPDLVIEGDQFHRTFIKP
ncbi:MAG TPA: hypothetical protein VGP07_02425 [Polyangia bacterium]|jgi:hypothetical protein